VVVVVVVAGREGERACEEARRRNLCPHKWLPGSAVAHLPLIPTPRLTFASSFLCSSCPPLYLLPAASLTLSPPTAHVCTAGVEGREGRAGHRARLFIFRYFRSAARDTPLRCTRSSTSTTCRDIPADVTGCPKVDPVRRHTGHGNRLIVMDRPRSLRDERLAGRNLEDSSRVKRETDSRPSRS